MQKRKSLKELFNILIPKYAVPWVAALIISLFVVYYGSVLVTAGFEHHYISTALDAKIPLIPQAVIVYCLYYIFWLVNFIIIARENRDTCSRVLTGVIISKLIALAVYILYPTTMVRPPVDGTDFFSSLLRFIYSVDKPTNLMPSIHCMDSWLCWRGLSGCKKVPRGYKTFSFIFAMMVCASTVLIHQHVLIDIPTGIICGEIGLFISKAFIYKNSSPEDTKN